MAIPQLVTISAGNFTGLLPIQVTTGVGDIDKVLATDATTGLIDKTFIPEFGTSDNGGVPASGGGSTNFLRADGSWAVPAGGGIPTQITVADEAADATCFLCFFTAATGDLGPKTNTALQFNSSTGVTTFGANINLGNNEILDVDRVEIRTTHL